MDCEPGKQTIMWKILNYGEKVSAGDTLRYRANSNSLLSADKTYLVTRSDQHYFEMIEKTDDNNASEPPPRKAVRYMDIGYNILLERWLVPNNN